jgi:hypothetical protein
MRRAIVLVVLGVLGLFAATGLTLGALALAGEGAGTVVHPRLAPAGTSSSAEREDSRTPSASPSVDDHGGGLEAGDDHGGSTNSGSSNSGSGSSNSGSGSSNSGSGSSNSGSGSSGSGSDDD